MPRRHRRANHDHVSCRSGSSRAMPVVSDPGSSGAVHDLIRLQDSTPSQGRGRWTVGKPRGRPTRDERPAAGPQGMLFPAQAACRHPPARPRRPPRFLPGAWQSDLVGFCQPTANRLPNRRQQLCRKSTLATLRTTTLARPSGDSGPLSRNDTESPIWLRFQYYWFQTQQPSLDRATSTATGGGSTRTLPQAFHFRPARSDIAIAQQTR
jgi:hypothetical protein